ncbi:hypothetical protein BGZ54_000169 [Gamsiella multidivaricata]|nr:hypothetical protein BGZ54_000169 [Gamsiella multidivaricata]
MPHSQHPSTLLKKTPPALSIPEVVVTILKSLPRRDLLQAAPFVCKRWYLLGRPLIHPTDFYWLGRIPLTEQYLLEGIRNIQTLPIISSTSSCYYVRPTKRSDWGLMQKQIAQLWVKNAAEYFQELVIAGNLSMDLAALEPVVVLFSSLRSVKIENSWMETIDIGPILEGCVALERLNIDSTFCRKQTLEDETKDQDTLSEKGKLARLQLPERSTATNLKSISFQRVEVEFAKLERLLAGSCSKSPMPGIIELLMEHIIVLLPQSVVRQEQKAVEGSRTIAATLAYQSQILDTIHRLCPYLNSIHFSLLDCRPRQQDQALLFRHFPTIQRWSLPYSDVLPSTFVSLQTYVNNVISLELTCFSSTVSPMTLHEYLCNSPQLRRLCIHNMVYPAEYMDLEPVAEGKEGLYSPRNCQDTSSTPAVSSTGDYENSSSQLWLQRRVWACRSLETLQIKIGGHSGDTRSGRNSRVMFAYLCLVCPNLRELSITREMMNVELEGGLCYLGAMESLETLTLQSTHFWIKHVSDIGWIQRSSRAAAEAAAAAAAKKRSRAAKPAATSKNNMSRNISRTTTRSSLVSRSAVSFGRSKTRVSVSSGKKGLLSRVARKLFGKNGYEGEAMTRSRTTTSAENSSTLASRFERADEKQIIQRLISMFQPEGVSKFLEKLERRKLRAEQRERKGYDDDEEEVGYCWPDMKVFVMDAVKFSGVSSQSLEATVRQLRPEITFRAFS